MKIIISHDVDHLYRRDHYHDLIFVKRGIRAILELLKRDICAKECFYRIWEMFLFQQHHIEEIMMWDKKNGIPSTFFFGVEKGLGMNYSLSDAIPVIKKVEENNFSVGLHGISYNKKNKMQQEHVKFKKILGNDNFGIRMHYVRQDKTTFKMLSQLNYLFDTSEFNKKTGHCLKFPYKVGNMWEFPLCMMDGYLPKKLEEKKDETKKMLETGKRRGLPYFTILFHDCFFSDAYLTMKEWYMWIVEYLKEEGYEFISYFDAINELEKED